MEALMASGILLVIVVAVTTAITAGQQHAFEAQQRIAGALAAEELMCRLLTEPYDSLSGWNGFTEPVGTLTDMGGRPMPESFDAVGREVEVETRIEQLTDLGVNIRGRSVIVRAVDTEGRVLAELSRFIPEPQS
jgi:hypothetical protein